jgi:transcriptional regulator with PAS, ATPase and Fis domain
MPPKGQGDLLRVIEEGMFRRVGSSDLTHCNVRIIAATNKHLEQHVKDGHFREDLFYRLHVVPIQLPPLCERVEDIPLLIEAFLTHFAARHKRAAKVMSPDALQLCQRYRWPGNVRELRNVIERAVILESTPEIQPSSLPDFHLEGRLRKSEVTPVTGAQSIDELMADFERQLILNTLEQSRYNISKTSEQLKISRHALRYRMQRLNINLDAADETADGKDGAA